MASIISAGTTSGTSLNLSGDTSGVLQLATNGSTTAVTISTGQLVGIGTTSPDGLLTLPATASNTPKIRLQSATSDVDVTISSYADSSGTYAAFGSNFYLNSTGDEAVFDLAKRSSFIRVDGRNTGAITFGTATTGVTAERMRIDSSGNVGIGTSSPAAVTGFSTGRTVLQVTPSGGGSAQLRLGAASGTMIDHDDNGNTITTIRSLYGATSASAQMQLQSGFITFGTGTSFTERMRITSGGYTKMSNDGTYVSSTGSYHEAVSNFDNNTLVVRNSNGSLTSNGILYIDANRNTTYGAFYALSYYNNGAGAFKFIVADSGNVTNTNGSYGTISDIKNKENIVDATPKLEKVNQLKVRNFNFIGDDLKQIGFVAQEFEQVFPSMVEEHQDRDKEGNHLGTTTKSIKTSVLVPILVKAIQEQQAMIEELKQEVAALKGVN